MRNLEDVIRDSIKHEIEQVGERLKREYEQKFRERLHIVLAKTLGAVKLHAQQNQVSQNIELTVVVEMPEESIESK